MISLITLSLLEVYQIRVAMSAQPGTDLSGQPKPTFAINKTGLSHPSRLHHNAVLVRPEAAMYLTQIIPATIQHKF
jgi:hypothetical protein